MKAQEFYIVFYPMPDSEKSEIFTGRPMTLIDLANMFRGGLYAEMVQGIYTDKAEAEQEAEKLYKEHLRARNEEDPFDYSKEERFEKFVRTFEKLSSRFGVIVTSTGGVIILKKREDVHYTDDPTSGDIGIAWPN